MDAVAERFWAKVNKTETCWLWTGSQNGRGYGQFTVNQRQFYAHRWAYEFLVGPIPPGLHIDHLCRVPGCVNPRHLEPVTQRTNTLRGISNSAVNAVKTHCDSGHALDSANTHIRTDGKRECRVCKRLRQRAIRERARAAAIGDAPPKGGWPFAKVLRDGGHPAPGDTERMERALDEYDGDASPTEPSRTKELQ